MLDETIKVCHRRLCEQQTSVDELMACSALANKLSHGEDAKNDARSPVASISASM